MATYAEILARTMGGSGKTTAQSEASKPAAETLAGASGGTKITPQSISQPTTGQLSAGGNLALGKGPIAAQSQSQAFQNAIKNPVSLPGSVAQSAAGVKAPVVLKQQTGAADAFKNVLDQGKSMVDAMVSKAPTEAKAANDYDLTEYLKRQSAAKVESQLAGLKGAYEKAMTGYDAQAKKLPQSFEAARNQAAAQNAIATRAFQERAAASGLNSGTGGQAELARSAAYQAALAGIDTNQANAEAELDLARADLTAEYETAIAQARADGDATLAQALYQELIRTQGLAREDEQTSYNREQDAYQKEQDALAWDYKRKQEADAKALDSATLLAGQGSFDALGAYYGWDANTVQFMAEQYQLAQYRAALNEAAAEAKTQADNLIKMGLMPDANTLELAGYSTDYAQRLSKVYADKLASASKGGTSGGSNGGTAKTTAVNDGGVDTLTKLYQDMRKSADPGTYLSMNYKKYGVAYQMLSNVMSGYNAWAAKYASVNSFESLSSRISHIGPGVTTGQLQSLKNEIQRSYEAGEISRAQLDELGSQLGYKT